MVFIGLGMIGCGNAEYGVNAPECDTETVGNEYVTTCTNGTVINIPIPPPPQDGVDGNDGGPGAVLASVDVSAGQCVEVSPGIWAGVCSQPKYQVILPHTDQHLHQH